MLFIEPVAGADGPKTEGEEVSPGVMLLYDGDGPLSSAFEITAASKTLGPGALDNLPVRISADRIATSRACRSTARPR